MDQSAMQLDQSGWEEGRKKEKQKRERERSRKKQRRREGGKFASGWKSQEKKKGKTVEAFRHPTRV
jgi:hypothetical protein